MPQWNRRDALWLLGAAAVPLPVFAEDPWVAKKPSDWTEKEFHRLLNDSPWAKPVSISMGSSLPSNNSGRGRGGRGGGGSTMPSADSSANMGGSPMGADTGGRGGGSGVTNDGPMAPPSVIYMVRWMSARPMKIALLRSRLGAEADTSPQAKAILEKEEQFYVITVSGPPKKEGGEGERRRQLSPQAEAQVKEATTLSWKSHDKIHPLVVQVSQTGTLGFSFSFPRTQAIELEDKEVEFATKLGELSIKRKFKLKDMLFEGKLAI